MNVVVKESLLVAPATAPACFRCGHGEADSVPARNSLLLLASQLENQDRNSASRLPFVQGKLVARSRDRLVRIQHRTGGEGRQMVDGRRFTAHLLSTTRAIAMIPAGVCPAVWSSCRVALLGTARRSRIFYAMRLSEWCESHRPQVPSFELSNVMPSDHRGSQLRRPSAINRLTLQSTPSCSAIHVELLSVHVIDGGTGTRSRPLPSAALYAIRLHLPNSIPATSLSQVRRNWFFLLETRKARESRASGPTSALCLLLDFESPRTVPVPSESVLPVEEQDVFSFSRTFTFAETRLDVLTYAS
jgi:hypothetical protein